MGAEESKAHVEHNGDQHVEIFNMQAEHSLKLDQQTTLLLLILAGVVIQLALSISTQCQKRLNKKIMKKAESMCKLSHVTAQEWCERAQKHRKKHSNLDTVTKLTKWLNGEYHRREINP